MIKYVLIFSFIIFFSCGKNDDCVEIEEKREINGDVLSKVQPIPKGRVLKTICCSNIPIFVPKNIDSKNLF